MSFAQRLHSYRRYLRMSDPEHLEAPDRSFIGHRDIITRNLARYRLIEPHVRGTIADIGCGRGYGIEALRGRFSSCVGIDLSRDFLGELHANQPDIPVLLATGEHLPLGDQSLDTLIAFEVIEHLDDDEGFLWELRRTLRPGGMLAISTPNRAAASGGAAQPLNKFHVREYLPDEFRRLLARVFSDFVLLGQYEYDQGPAASSPIDLIPIEWKYRIPIHIQGMISVVVRPPLLLKDCHFAPDGLDHAHTLLAMCHIPAA